MERELLHLVWPPPFAKPSSAVIRERRPAWHTIDVSGSIRKKSNNHNRRRVVCLPRGVLLIVRCSARQLALFRSRICIMRLFSLLAITLTLCAALVSAYDMEVYPQTVSHTRETCLDDRVIIHVFSFAALWFSTVDDVRW